MRLCSCLVAAAAGVFVPAVCFSQQNGQPPFYTTVASPGGPTPAHIYAIDVNNDGITDIIADNAQSGGSFTVSICNGDGTFKPPVTYKINSTSSSPTPITYGDFNNDGKVDIAVSIPGTNQVAVYLGNGDGTFQYPITLTLNLPGYISFASTPIVAADFNHDGNLDLVAAAEISGGGTWLIYLLPGDGAGGFTDAVPIYSLTSGWGVQTIVTGDFDGDNNADVSVLEWMPCSSGSTQSCKSNLITLFGTGGTTSDFNHVNVTTVDGAMSLGSGTLRNNSVTDLFGFEFGSNQQAAFLGNYDRRFSYFYTSLPGQSGQVVGNSIADSDTIGDLVAPICYPSGSGPCDEELVWFMNVDNGEDFQVQYGTLTYNNLQHYVGPVAGNFNGDLLPDILISESSGPTSSSSYLVAGLNQTSSAGGGFGRCNYPSSGQGFRLCSPSSQTTAGQTQISASVNSFGQLRKIEFWLDGKKQGEEYNVWGHNGWFEWSLQNLAAGTHTASLNADNIDDSHIKLDFNITAGGTCGPPPQGANGVNVCEPAWNGNYTDPVPVLATAKITGTLASMELWVDGVKTYTENTGTTLATTVTLSQTYHTVEVIASNTAGQTWETTVGFSAFQ